MTYLICSKRRKRLKRIPPKNKRTIKNSSAEYTHPYNMEESFNFRKELYNAAEAPIDSLGLTIGQKLHYLFDFGEEWWHEITVEKSDKTLMQGSLPKVIEKHGDSPSQLARSGNANREGVHGEPRSRTCGTGVRRRCRNTSNPTRPCNHSPKTT